MKPCPFCGNTKIQELYLEDDWVCEWCDRCKACGPAKQSDEEARRAWNERAGKDEEFEPDGTVDYGN